MPVGLDEPVWCNIIKWIITNAAINNGRRKCSEKKRFSVGWETEKFPHNHWVTVVPKYGIAEIIDVITVAPQNDICPHGRTYPINAAPIDANKITTPELHTIGNFDGELK